jgi:hypothetical protein
MLLKSQAVSRARCGIQGARHLHYASLAQTGRIDEARTHLEIVRRE